ncbi:MAG TPA: glycosyl hydrolase family 8 [Candidatus Angelobacter sp.]|nr:glycosyl hydrolase family 8 [Candidatus Angelobacter sp.]
MPVQQKKYRRIRVFPQFGRHHGLFTFLGLAAFFLVLCSRAEAAGHGAFATGDYRNLFAESGRSQSECRLKIDAAFEQLFHGNATNQSVYFPAGTNSNGSLAYVMDVAHQDVRSEGMSYGMMIAVELNKKAEFDALWNWARTFMYHDATNHPAEGYFSWSMRTNGQPNDEMPAPDGEEYFVTALYFASGRWGDGHGLYNYKAQADHLLSNLKNRQPIAGKTIHGDQTGRALFDPVQKMVRFSADLNSDCPTDPSYQLPAFYELWSRWGPPEELEFWHAAAVTSRKLFEETVNPVTGLSPDYANFDGRPWGHSGSQNFRFDAWRVAMNWSVDWSWWAADPREQKLSDRLLSFFNSHDFAGYGNQFTLDGRQLSKDHSTGLVAMNAVAALAATKPFAKKYAAALWNAPVPDGTYRYYDGLLYMLGMLHCSGEFRIWAPGQQWAHSH